MPHCNLGCEMPSSGLGMKVHLTAVHASKTAGEDYALAVHNRHRAAPLAAGSITCDPLMFSS